MFEQVYLYLQKWLLLNSINCMNSTNFIEDLEIKDKCPNNEIYEGDDEKPYKPDLSKNSNDSDSEDKKDNQNN